MSMFSITSSSLDPAARRPCARTGRGSRTPGRSARSPARASVADVLRVRAHREQAGVDPRVERLDAAVEDLREAGVVLDRARRRCPSPASSRAVPPVETISTPSSARPRAKSDQPALVGHGQQRAAHAHLARLRPDLGRDAARSVARHRPSPRSARGAGSSGSSRTAPRGDQADRARQQPVLDLVDASPPPPRCREHTEASNGSCRMIGPLSTPSSTKWTVTPVTRTPYSIACSIARSPGRPGRSDGWTLIDPAREAADELGAQQLHEPGEHDEPDGPRLEPVGERARRAPPAPRSPARRTPPSRRRPPRRALERGHALATRGDAHHLDAIVAVHASRGSPAGSCPRPRRGRPARSPLTPRGSRAAPPGPGRALRSWLSRRSAISSSIRARMSARRMLAEVP